MSIRVLPRCEQLLQRLGDVRDRGKREAHNQQRGQPLRGGRRQGGDQAHQRRRQHDRRVGELELAKRWGYVRQRRLLHRLGVPGLRELLCQGHQFLRSPCCHGLRHDQRRRPSHGLRQPCLPASRIQPQRHHFTR